MAGSCIYRFAGIELDSLRGSLRRDGREQYPRAKVLQVLLYLLEHRDRLVTKEELIDHIWKKTAVTDDAVFHCMMEIRTLLGENREGPHFIRTFAGAGYRFVAPVEEIPSPGSETVRTASTTRVWVASAVGLAVFATAWAGLHHLWQSAARPQGEAAWWRLDEGSGTRVRDSSGHGNDGVLVGNPVWIDGKLGKALEFEGVRSHVMASHPAGSLPKGSEPRTLTAWIRAFSTNGDETSIFHYGIPASRSFPLSLRDNGLAAAGYSTDEVVGTSRLDDGAWHFVAATYEGPATDVARIFVDGVQESARKLRSPPDTKSGPTWRIGRHVESGTPFRGAIDDVRVYAQALSPPSLTALYRCSSRQDDFTLDGGGRFYYLPVFGYTDIEIGPSGEIRNAGMDFGGIQFARSDGVCAIGSLRGADVGQNLSVNVDLLVPSQLPGQAVAAGPYFRGRAAAPGDGIAGGTCAGYWVQLYSTGVVKVRRLNPQQVVAFTAAPAEFDAKRFHRLEITANASELQVSLDSRVLEFDQGGRTVRAVSIPSTWEGPPRTGYNHGTAGIAFSAEPRGKGTGQQARNLAISRLPSAALRED